MLKFGELYESRPDSVPEPLRQEEGIEMALDQMRKACASDEVRELVELRKKAQRDEATRLERELLEAQKETARRLREAGVDAETIRQATGVDLATLDE